MQKPIIKCVVRKRAGRFLHNRKKLIWRFQKTAEIFSKLISESFDQKHCS
jgi:hypothetical protein